MLRAIIWVPRLSFILDSKSSLGLAKPPVEREAVEPLDEQQLIERALSERQQRAKDEKFTVEACRRKTARRRGRITLSPANSAAKHIESHCAVPNPAIRICTCPDYRSNTLGTCKHILHTLQKIRRRFEPAAFKKRPKQKETSVYLKYGIDLALRLGTPDRPSESAAKIIGPIQNVDISDINDLVRRIDKLEGLGESVVVYPDAEEFIQQQLHRQRIQGSCR